MKYRRLLFAIKDPYSLCSDKAFLRAVRENFAFQYAHCEKYRKIADAFHVREGSFKTIDDLRKLPVIPTLYFKRNDIKTSRALITAASSGTGGRVSEIGYDAGGLVCALKMAVGIAGRRGLISSVPTHYIIIGYKPRRDNRMGAVKSAFAATLLTPAIGRSYLLKYRDGSYFPDFEGIIREIISLERSAYPVRFMGFPAYTYFLMKIMDERKLRVRLPKGSKIMLGGGWKQFYAEQADKPSFYRLAKRVLGISERNIVEFFGAVEHPILYCDCPCHHFHIPAYSRVIIRSPDTLEPLPMGEAGLVDLITPMIKSAPLLSVMTDDLGVLHSGEECGCGIKTPYLEIIGRVAPADIRTCAAGAEELLKGAGL